MKADIRQYIEDKTDDKCCWVGCDADGTHPAPKSPSNLKEHYGFCLEHIRKYNKSWNFFCNMPDKEMEAYVKDSITGHRPTARMGTGFRKYNAEDLREQVFREFSFHYESKKPQAEIPSNERESLQTLGLKCPVTMKGIKAKYKELAKRYHPDLNGGADNDRLKAINQAYSYLKSCGYFK